MADDRDGIIVEVVEVGPRLFAWAMRKGDAAPFLRSNGHFGLAKHAEINARKVVAKANKRVAYVVSVTAEN